MFKFVGSVRKHFKNHHETETPFFCKKCNLVLKSSTALENHVKSEHEGKIVQNPVKMSPTNPRKSPTNPRKSHTNPPKSPTNPRKSPTETYLICIVCRETGFESIKSLVDHRYGNSDYRLFS